MNINYNSLENNVGINNFQTVNINNTIMEVSNIYPDNLKKRDLRANERSLIAQLRTDAYSICRTEIPIEYIRTVFNKFKRGFVYYAEKMPVAFCIWKVREHTSIIDSKLNYKILHIYLLCGKQLDYKLVPRILDDIVHYCRINNIRFISLEPANANLKSYYIQCGFEEKQDIGGINMLVLDVSKSRTKLYNLSKSLTKTRKHRRHRATNMQSIMK